MRKIFCAVFFIAITFQMLHAQSLSVASYNVRNDNKSDSVEGNGWRQRCPVICQLLNYNDFDIIGTQEVKHGQLIDMLAGMPAYDYVGVGRDDGKTGGEYAPILYKKERFEILKSGNFWLAEKIDHPNVGWDAALPRICTWVELRDKVSNQRFWFFNLHMDHIGVQARRESAKLVLAQIKKMCADDRVILTGDFNVDQTHNSYKILANSKILNDSYDVAKLRYCLNGTFNAFDTSLKTDSRIDHIFVSPSFGVDKYGVLTDTYRSNIEGNKEFKSGNFPKEVSLTKYQSRLPSDHFPIAVKLVF